MEHIIHIIVVEKKIVYKILVTSSLEFNVIKLIARLWSCCTLVKPFFQINGLAIVHPKAVIIHEWPLPSCV